MMQRTLLALLGSALLVGPTPSFGQDHDHDHKDHDHKEAAPATTAKAADAAHADHAGHDHEGGHEEHADEVKLTEAAVRASGIKIESAKPKTLSPTLTAPGRVAFDANAMAHVGTPVAGRVVEIKARFGDVVKKGDELAVIESPELGEAQSDLIQKQAAVAVARAAIGPAKESAERAKKLYDQNQSIALAELQKRQADAIAADGAFQTAAASAMASENKLRLLGMDRPAIENLLRTGNILPRYSLRATLGGTVVQFDLTQGEYVHPEKDALLVLADLSSVWVWADVPEAELPRLKPGLPADVMLPTAADAIAGKVSLIAPQINADTRTGRVRIDLPNADGTLRAGMFVQARLTLPQAGDGAQQIAVPQEAVQTVEGAPAVFVPVEGEPNTFAKRTVKVGPAVGGLVPVLDGLKEGEAFVSRGSFILKADLGKAGAAHEH